MLASSRSMCVRCRARTDHDARNGRVSDAVASPTHTIAPALRDDREARGEALVLASDNILSETHSPDAAMPAPRAQTVSTHACSTDIVGASASMRELLITIERL